jgi:predicted nucleotidyltransferase
MVGTRDEAIAVLRRDWAELSRRGVARIALFGSFRRDAADAASDVDLLVEFAEGQKTFRNFMAVALFLEDSLGRRVELVTPDSLSPYLREPILREILYVGP